MVYSLVSKNRDAVFMVFIFSVRLKLLPYSISFVVFVGISTFYLPFSYFITVQYASNQEKTI